MKRCPKCNETKEDDAFYRNPNNGKLHSHCRPCAKIWQKENRVLHKDARDAQNKAWRLANPDKMAINYAKWAVKNRLVYESDRRAKVRREVFEAYGGYRCACCGETQPMFLTIDHIENDGASHRRELNTKIGKGGTPFFDWLRRMKFPPGFQVLCRNCNWGKHANGGVCPHRDPEGSTTRAAARSSEWSEAQDTSNANEVVI